MIKKRKSKKPAIMIILFLVVLITAAAFTAAVRYSSENSLTLSTAEIKYVHDSEKHSTYGVEEMNMVGLNTYLRTTGPSIIDEDISKIIKITSNEDNCAIMLNDINGKILNENGNSYSWPTSGNTYLITLKKSDSGFNAHFGRLNGTEIFPISTTEMGPPAPPPKCFSTRQTSTPLSKQAESAVKIGSSGQACGGALMICGASGRFDLLKKCTDLGGVISSFGTLDACINCIVPLRCPTGYTCIDSYISKGCTVRQSYYVSFTCDQLPAETGYGNCVKCPNELAPHYWKSDGECRSEPETEIEYCSSSTDCGSNNYCSQGGTCAPKLSAKEVCGTPIEGTDNKQLTCKSGTSSGNFPCKCN